MNIDDFTGNNVNFSLAGAGQIIGENCEIENLVVESNGAVNLDFRERRSRNA
jgi:hypothetical protein